jgi:hypothetical protein
MRAARRGVAADESEREAVASATLLPLLRQQEDIVHLVLRLGQWALLLDKPTTDNTKIKPTSFFINELSPSRRAKQLRSARWRVSSEAGAAARPGDHDSPDAEEY